jgi:isopenicillin N synthase-like dioxygenase
VINRAGIGRYSIPFFYDPDFDARFDSLPQFSAGEFCWRSSTSSTSTARS